MSVSDLTERCRPLAGKLHAMSAENAMCLIADLDQLYSDMPAARVDDAIRWEALTFLIKAAIPNIDHGGIRDVIGWWSDLSRGKLSLLEGELAKISRQGAVARQKTALAIRKDALKTARPARARARPRDERMKP